MATTPTFGWPYQALTDRPDGPNLGEDMALAIEATTQSLLARIVQLEASVADLGPKLYRARQTVVTPGILVTFADIPANLRSLQVIYTCQAAAAGAFAIHGRINNDSGAAQYHSTDFGSSAAAFSAVTNVIGSAQGQMGTANGNNVAAEFGAGLITFAGWDGPHASRLSWVANAFAPASVAAGTFGRFQGGTYVGAAPYTRLDLFVAGGVTNWSAGSDFQLIGHYA